MSNTTDDLESLRKQYSTHLDDSVFYAISSDYDLGNPQSRADFVTILDQLSEAAIVEDAANDEAITEPSNAGGDSRTTPDSDQNVTNVTSDISNLQLSTSGESLSGDLEHLSGPAKRKYLKDLFPGTENTKLDGILATNGSIRAAIDELLTIAFISTYDTYADNDGPARKGIDAFAEEYRPDRGRKHRSKRKTRTNESSRANSVGSSRTQTPVGDNPWGRGDIEFICSRTVLSSQSVSSIYHAKGANISRTIKEIAAREKTKLPTFELTDIIVQMQVHELREDFPQVSVSTIQALLHLARNIPSATGELIEAMINSSPADDITSGKLNGVVQYAPVKIDETDTDWTQVTSPASNINYNANHSLAAGQAFTQAAAAARRAKSDRFMGGAAAYYASIGHEHIKIAKAETAAAADALVNQQSTRTKIDLHGVSVSDAVRIANARTNAWWDGLGDAKFASGGGGPVRAGFQIVTGLGTHSRNNAPRIGPAVAKNLVNGGWKVQVGHGEMFVYGKVRR